MCFIMIQCKNYSALYNANLHRLTCNMSLYKSEIEKKLTIFYLVIFTFYQILKVREQRFTKVTSKEEKGLLWASCKNLFQF